MCCVRVGEGETRECGGDGNCTQSREMEGPKQTSDSGKVCWPSLFARHAASH